RIIEPAIDLAIALAIASAHTNRPLPAGTLAIGELGLGGEIRTVPQLEQRLREASRLGLGHGIVLHMGGNIPKLGGMALHPVRRWSKTLADLGELIATTALAAIPRGNRLVEINQGHGTSPQICI